MAFMKEMSRQTRPALLSVTRLAHKLCINFLIVTLFLFFLTVIQIDAAQHHKATLGECGRTVKRIHECIFLLGPIGRKKQPNKKINIFWKLKSNWKQYDCYVQYESLLTGKYGEHKIKRLNIPQQLVEILSLT